MLLKPIHWKGFPRDLLKIQVGFALFGVAIALMIRANLGTGAWAVLEVALSRIFRLTPGTITVLMGFLVLSGALILREPIGWEDLALSQIPSVKDNLPLQITMLLAAIGIMGLASAIYIGVDAGAGPRDSLMLAIKRKTSVSIRVARGGIELTVVFLGWLMGGPAGLGTLIYALLVGPSVQLGFKLFKVEPHREVDSEVEDG
jgi:uncharacterized membrane protein YczE